MKCPLFYMMNYTQAGELGYKVGDCLKEECAWWNEKDEECSVKLAASFIAGMGMNLAEIKDKMPHEGQFRK
ncbi:hypothetical protein ES708_21921 [subsurface metagenome]